VTLLIVIDLLIIQSYNSLNSSASLVCQPLVLTRDQNQIENYCHERLHCLKIVYLTFRNSMNCDEVFV